ncbi:TPA: hypothetical protein OUI97_003232 [Pseudomonas aeruginosa]|uniref:hypothetical protein n=1 Tax=Pseudomonas aeruginosa TaxID=287 RepID=UPI0022926F43|nr:hypothetical protein [Pseudomonas aeruginosa]MDV7882171.1 hypothetical protein [Pseudomonas aeruginosa]HCF7686936.1 hypothetical protein [Pseudomonas aeruginosa]HCU0443865.1 hypothetical protein [Pseudomonas aeruginosa]
MSDFPPAQSEIKEKSIKQLLTSTGLILRNILRKNWPQELNSQIDREIMTLANVEKIKWIAISKCWSHTYEEEKRSAFKLNFFYAKLYYLCAKSAFKEGKIDEAWPYLSYSANLIGFLEGYKYKKEEEKLRSSRASKGGKDLQLKKLCCGPLTPDTFLDEDDRHAEVFHEQTTTYFQPCLLSARLPAWCSTKATVVLNPPNPRDGRDCITRWVAQLQLERAGVKPDAKALTPKQQTIQQFQTCINRLSLRKNLKGWHRDQCRPIFNRLGFKTGSI